jgi:methylmalonyl-CoA/ethylmalonyl-CoA epimerase
MGIQARNPNEDEDEQDGRGVGGEPIDEAYDGGVSASMLTAIDHVAIVVEDLGEAIAEHRDAFGVLVGDREDLHDEGAEIAFLDVGGSTIALIAPTSDDSEYREFLDEGGPGLHHVAYRVADLDAAMEALREAGRELIDEEPVAGPRGSRVAFVHPDSAFGVLVQLVER